mmetsp:Transcript_21908/g.62596  ORF Transcript_21908/g.62596 Transcript_21908/m.62596 type:complete len:426 (-) Transcript_21908:969-2246(-)
MAASAASFAASAREACNNCATRSKTPPFSEVATVGKRALSPLPMSCRSFVWRARTSSFKLPMHCKCLTRKLACWTLASSPSPALRGLLSLSDALSVLPGALSALSGLSAASPSSLWPRVSKADSASGVAPLAAAAGTLPAGRAWRGLSACLAFSASRSACCARCARSSTARLQPISKAAVAVPMASSAAQRTTRAVRARLSAKSRAPAAMSTSLVARSILSKVASSCSLIFSRCSAVVAQDSPTFFMMPARSLRPAPAIKVSAQSPYSASAVSVQAATRIAQSRMERRWWAPCRSCPALMRVRVCISRSEARFGNARASALRSLNAKLEWAKTAMASAAVRASAALPAASLVLGATSSSTKPSSLGAGAWPRRAAASAPAPSWPSGPLDDMRRRSTAEYACWISWKRSLLSTPALSGCSFRAKVR